MSILLQDNNECDLLIKEQRRTDLYHFRDNTGKIALSLLSGSGGYNILPPMSNKESYQALFLYATEGILIINEQGEILRINPSAERLFGYEPDELVGKSIETLVPERFSLLHHDFRKSFNQHPRARAMAAGLDLYARHKNGSEIPVAISLSPFTSPNGSFVIAFIVDNTLRKQAEEKLRNYSIELEKQMQEVQRRTEELDALNKELEAFSYTISHDLRSPLRSISNFTHILSEECDANAKEDVKYAMSAIIRNAMRMSQLIDDLLEFSRLGKQNIRHTWVNMNELVNNVITDLQKDTGPAAHIVVHPLGDILADPRMIRQVLLNLVSNALKYTGKKEAASIEIGWYTDKENDVYYVKDNGAGFDMAYYSKLFGVFQRLHRTNEFEGTGVGLAIVNRIISRHGGKVWAEGKVDEGATFYFSLPRND